MYVKRLFVFLLLLSPYILTCQDLHYINYDTKDGLAGSTVYSMCQDKDRFIWFATENGLSRFDGTRFTNFTVKDGLPDNEVLLVFADSKGRVWIGTFSNQVCFYYDGKIYNSKNSVLPKKIECGRNLETITENKEGFLGLSFRDTIIIITPADSAVKYAVNSIGNMNGVEGAVFNYFGAIRITINTRLDNPSYSYSVFEFNTLLIGWVKKYEELSLKEKYADSVLATVKTDPITNRHAQIVVPGKVYSFEAKNGIREFLSTTDGAWSINSYSLQLEKHFLSGKKFRERSSMQKKIYGSVL